MSEPGSFEPLPDREDEAQVSAVPPLPIEAPPVRALEALKGQADLALLLLEHCPRDEAQIRAAINGAISQVTIASDTMWTVAHIRSCKGQA